MTEQTDAAEVGELAPIIHRALEPLAAEDAPGCPEDDEGFVGCFAVAHTILTSKWLADREAQMRELGKFDTMAGVLDPKGPIWNRMHADGWDEGYRAGQAAAAGTYGDGSEAPTNPYRAAVVAARGAEGGAGA